MTADADEPKSEPGGSPGELSLHGQLVRRMPPHMLPRAPVAGCLLLTAAYAAISAELFTGHHAEALLVVLLALGV